MSDPNYAHEFDGNRQGKCKTIVSGAMCHQLEGALVHTRWTLLEKQRTSSPVPAVYLANPVIAGRPQRFICQEASVFSGSKYIPCGEDATKLVLSERGRRIYPMCDACADHNVQNRGAVLVATHEDLNV